MITTTTTQSCEYRCNIVCVIWRPQGFATKLAVRCAMRELQTEQSMGRIL